MTKETKIIKRNVELSRNGYPVIWESGGAGTNTGRSQIICNSKGEKKVAIFVKHGGHLASKDHALHSVREKDIIIKAHQHRGDYSITVQQVIEAKKEQKYIVVKEIHNYKENEGGWDIKPEPFLADAIEAAIKKARAYHCRSVYYTIEKEKKII